MGDHFPLMSSERWPQDTTPRYLMITMQSSKPEVCLPVTTVPPPHSPDWLTVSVSVDSQYECRPFLENWALFCACSDHPKNPILHLDFIGSGFKQKSTKSIL